MNTLSHAFVLATLAAAFSAHGGVLYKSISPSGVVEFSDHKPGDDREIVALVTDGATRPVDSERARRLDQAVVLANDQLDLAEHDLAAARAARSAPPEALRFGERRFTAPEATRVAYCKKKVADARRALLDAVRRQRYAEAQVLASR